MKKLIISITAAMVLTAVFLLTLWSCPKDKDDQNSLQSQISGFSSPAELSIISDDFYSAEINASEETSEIFKDSFGPLFSTCKEITDSGIYKLVVIRQKRFGGNSVPVETTTYYGDGFINVIEREGHGLTSETFIDESGTYCFDSSSEIIYYLPELAVDTDKLITKGVRYLSTGDTAIGTTTYVYESYETNDGKRIDYLFLGTELKKIKEYGDGDNYEIVNVELSADISMARSSLPENATVIEGLS